ncbi:uncharacterized protein [Eurosta solidaginis]|uniref:uncharacterized protein isoform X2 n=1 Tax=Eurosta solidaginis TaxID=178769 RepID=UPI0035315775
MCDKRKIDCGMDIESLFLIKEDDINELIPLSMLGTRIKFKQRLANLKENKENIMCFLESSNSSLSCSHKSQPVAASTPVKSLGEILKAIPWGQSILQQYKEHCLLLDKHRQALIEIDFEFEYPDKSQICSPNGLILQRLYMKEKVKDSASKNLLAKIETSLNDGNLIPIL